MDYWYLSDPIAWQVWQYSAYNEQLWPHDHPVSQAKTSHLHLPLIASQGLFSKVYSSLMQMYYNIYCIIITVDDMALFQNLRGLPYWNSSYPPHDIFSHHIVLLPGELTQLAGCLLYHSLSFHRGLFCSGPHLKLAAFCVSWEMGQSSIYPSM